MILLSIRDRSGKRQRLTGVRVRYARRSTSLTTVIGGLGVAAVLRGSPGTDRPPGCGGTRPGSARSGPRPTLGRFAAAGPLRSLGQAAEHADQGFQCGLRDGRQRLTEGLGRVGANRDRLRPLRLGCVACGSVEFGADIARRFAAAGGGALVLRERAHRSNEMLRRFAASKKPRNKVSPFPRGRGWGMSRESRSTHPQFPPARGGGVLPPSLDCPRTRSNRQRIEPILRPTAPIAFDGKQHRSLLSTTSNRSGVKRCACPRIG